MHRASISSRQTYSCSYSRCCCASCIVELFFPFEFFVSFAHRTEAASSKTSCNCDFKSRSVSTECRRVWREEILCEGYNLGPKAQRQLQLLGERAALLDLHLSECMCFVSTRLLSCSLSLPLLL